MAASGDGEDAASARLLAWLARQCGKAGLPPPAVAVRADSSGCRGLVTTHAAAAGDVLLCVPWRAALTVHSSTLRLAAAERAGVPLTRAPIAALLPLCAGGDHEVVPPGCGSATLLALGLLAELRDPRSPLAPYVSALPAPSGTPLARLCLGPNEDGHLSLCSPAALDALCCAPLAASVCAERARLARLHAQLFGDDDPAVSLASFSWAHALVASRALDLLAPGEDASSVRCLLPLIDFANHAAGGAATARLRMCMDAAGGAPLCVQLQAATALPKGAPLLLDYGARWLRRWAAAYGFVPTDGGAPVSEPFEEIAAAGESAMLLAECAGASCMRLCEVRMRASGATAGAAVCFVVRDTDAAGAAWMLPACVTLQSDDDGKRPERVATLPASREAELSAALSRRAADAVAALEAKHAQLGGEDACAQLAARLRAARIALLRRVSDDLAAMAALMQGAA